MRNTMMTVTPLLQMTQKLLDHFYIMVKPMEKMNLMKSSEN